MGERDKRSGGTSRCVTFCRPRHENEPSCEAPPMRRSSRHRAAGRAAHCCDDARDIGGVVRVEVVVAPNGTVKSTRLLGGNPILGQSAMKVIKQWRYAPAAIDETLTVKIEFDPHR